MKIFAAALIALGTLAATASLAQAQNFDHHRRDFHRHHGPVVVLGRHHGRDWNRHYRSHGLSAHRPHHNYN